MECSVWIQFAALATFLIAGCSSDKAQFAKVPARASVSSSVVSSPTSLCVDFNALTENYRISHFLESAVEIQSLEVSQREARLHQLAKSSAECGEVFVLCRMLLEDRSGAELRRPRLGAPSFVGTHFEAYQRDYDRLFKQWAQEPISIVSGVPILVVRGYTLMGLPERPEEYVGYCLAAGRWRTTRFANIAPAKLIEIVDQFIADHPCDEYEAEWLRSQAK